MTPRPSLLPLLVVCLALALGSAARGDTFTVTTTDDDGEGSLRDAIEEANNTTGDDVIVFELDAGSTIQLDTALENVMENLTLNGSDVTGLTVRGPDGMSFLSIDAMDQLTLRNLGLANGQVTVSDNAELRLTDGSFDVGTLNVAANGTVTVMSATLQPVTLTGSDISTFLGQLVFQEGTLNVDASSLPTDIINDGNFNNDSIVFIQSSDGTFSGEIVGPMADPSNGSVNKTGAGDLKVTGRIQADVFQVLDGPATFNDSTQFMGQLRIGVNGVLRGESGMGNIQKGGSAPGSSLISGTISPGVGVGDVGTLHTTLDLDFRPTSVLQIDLTESGADRLTANDADIQAGARLDLRIQGNPMGTETVLSAATPITGNFDFEDNFFFFTVTVGKSVGNDSITVDVSPSGATFGSGAQTPNQTAIADLLDANANDSMLQTDLFNPVASITLEEIPALLDSLTGESLVAFTNARLAAKSRLDNVIESRVVGFAAQHPGLVAEASRDARTGGAGPASLPLAGFSAGPRSGYYAFAPDAGEPGLGGWLDGHAVLGTVSGNGGAADVDYRVYGSTLGLDFRVSENFLVGAATGYSRLEPELSGRSEDGTGNVVHGALFGAAAWKLLHAAGWGRYAWGDYETSRRIGFGVNRTARGSFNGSDFSGHGEIAVRTPRLGGTVIEPFGSFDYTRLEQDGFTESGAGSLNLSVPGEDWTSLVSGVGARVHHVFELEPGMWFVPQLHGRWLHDFGDTDRRLTPTLGSVGTSFGPIQAAEPTRDSVAAGIRWTVNSNTGVHAFGDYEVGWSPDLLQHSVRAGFQLLF